MKRNFLAVGAFVFAIVLSSFTTSNKLSTVYFLFNGSSVEKDQNNYTYSTATQSAMSGASILAWFKGAAVSPSAPTSAEFNDSFEAIDGDKGGSDNDILRDETEDHDVLELKAND